MFNSKIRSGHGRLSYNWVNGRFDWVNKTYRLRYLINFTLMRIWITIISLFVCFNTIYAQEAKKVNKAAEALKKSLSEDDELKIAEGYEKLAQELQQKGQHKQAEEYWVKAREIYNRLNSKRTPVVSRNIGRAQESQKEYAKAIKSYEEAAAKTSDIALEVINKNDAERLRTPNPVSQIKLSKDNIELLEKMGDREEVADAYTNIAHTQLKELQPDAAANTLQKVIANSGNSRDVAVLSKKIAGEYSSVNELDNALDVAEAALTLAIKEQNTEVQIDLMLELSDLQYKRQKAAIAEAHLLDAYALAKQTHHTLLAAKAAAALSKYYQNQNSPDRSLQVLNSFMSGIDSILLHDSTITDSRILQANISRIRELENEKQLQYELIERKNTFNYVLGTSIVVLLLLVAALLKGWNAIRKKNMKIALQSLRREMNPHFVFNSLNSVNQFIAENNELEANKYLHSYSTLMRNVMEHSSKDFVTLSDELEQLHKYASLEYQRFKDKFNYEIKVDDDLDTDAILVPNMLIQPHMENAIWHGLRYKTEKGNLCVSFTQRGDCLEIVIQDDGIGHTQSIALKTEHQKQHNSRGLSNTKERVRLLNRVYRTAIEMNIESGDKYADTGCIVTIQLPIIMKSTWKK